MRTVGLAIVILLAACKDKQEAKPAPPPAPAPVKQEPVPKAEAPIPVEPTQVAIKPAGGINTAAEYEAKAYDLMDKLTAVFSASGTNCDKLAANLETFLDVNKDALVATDQFEAVNPSAEDDLEPKLQDKAKVFMQKISISMQACQKHAGVKAALAKLPD